jgi:predicted nucleic acid-binding protein
VTAYVDSSALVKLVVKEPESAALRSYLSSAGPLVTSILATVEVPRAVARVASNAGALVTAVLGTVTVIAFDRAIAGRAANLGPAPLRTLDAIHLTTALELAGELDAFVCYDERLSAGARALGLRVVAPE